jgi:MFS transporter, DHA2 family, multidrug resistance protein
MMFMLGTALYGATVLIPQLLQTLLGYTAQQAGMVLSPGSIVMVLSMPLVGRLMTKIDARYMIMGGFLVTSLALFHMTNLNLQVDYGTAVWMRIYQSIGLGFLFVPIQTLCYVGIPADKNNNVSGMTNLARNLGGSLGISGMSVILANRAQFHQSVLSTHTSEYNPVFRDQAAGLTQRFISMGNDAATATEMAYRMLYGQLERQAAMLGYVDAVYVFAWVCLLMVPAALLMKRAKGVKARSGH